ncbi:amino acid permease [Tanticharoenia sakaeratensis]|uniref:Amino acid/polyamine transporter n=1 Tax=Tanticharoenia sakaeratensis NBRC 103193 TaxID=1231623 RepID=A0A0D6MPZ8_9PROT|nr:amino acid permease [Tanticharoenia sakaeratensis]GAN55526.1 amino acid/polyamine transporter [Tanticharoenia sakaeratensis NBRC 103193]GBQ21829.1 amino acid/polyamine transporter [Tanticharoenia sakaeratensis NBRC 103193]
MTDQTDAATPRTGTLRSRHIVMIALGGVIGAGLFVGSSAAIEQAGPAVLLAYVATGALVVVVMRMLGEMLLAHPGIGSFVDCIRLAHGGGPAFLAGWLYWFFWAIAIGSEAIAGAISLHDWISLPVWVLAIGLILAVNLLNLISVNLFGECEFWLSLAKVACIVGFCGLGLLCVTHLVGPPPAILANLDAGGGPVPHGLAVVIGTIPTVLFSMIGSEAATVAAAESEDAGTNLARVTRNTGLRIMVFYLLSVALILCIVPWTTIRPGHSPFVSVMEAIGVPGASLIMRIVVLSAIISCLNSSIYITSRTLWGMARRGDAPAAFAHLSGHHVPQRAVAACSLFGLLVAACSILSPGLIFAFLLGASGAVILVVYGLIVSAHGALRRAGSARASGRFTLPRWLNSATLGGIALVLIAMLASPDGRGTVLASSLSVVVFLAAYVVRRASRARPLPDPS